MKLVLRLALAIIIIFVLALAFVWWNQPQAADMRAYVPADTLIYIEVNKLTDIATGIASTDAWKALAPPAGIRSNIGQLSRWQRLAAWTGIGPAESVVIGRAQVAVAVSGFATSSENEETFNIKPLFAVVIETHSSEARARALIMKRVGEFARKIYGTDQPTSKQADGIELMIWSAPTSEKYIVAAIESGVAVVGNDEGTVKACIATRRGLRPSLASNGEVEEMRRRVNGADALAFGYISAAGASTLLEIAARAYFGASTDTSAQSGAGSLFSQLRNKFIAGVGWSSHIVGGKVEDRYFINLQNGLAQNLKSPLTIDPTVKFGVSDFLPTETYSLSRYNYREPAAAWRGMKAVIYSQLDVAMAFFFSSKKLLDAVLVPYGIDEPDIFLRSVGPEIATARLDSTGEGTITIVEARDENALREFVKRRLGTNVKTEHMGDAEFLISSDVERGAAAFVAGRLLLGPEANLRRCLEARSQGQTLSHSEQFIRTAQTVSSDSSTNALTYTRETEAARDFITSLALQRGLRDHPPDVEGLNKSLEQLGYSVSGTNLVEGGFEKVTRSSFGLFGTLVTQIAGSSPQ
ncbi:MAG TPA: hypothetical protein VK619_18140 [Pyrinomonadaceae bacterium]|nr:hypothetical protein [Pyrinomonadaceae bacterium]